MPDVSLEDLKAAYRKEPPGKSRDRLQAAVGRKKGKSESAIATQLGRSQSVISEWLNRLQSEGLKGRYDRKSPGRPCRLTKEQQEQAKADLSREPMQCGFERGTWTAALFALHLANIFDVQYTWTGALALAHRMGFSIRMPRPIHHKSASPLEELHYVHNTIRAIMAHARAGYEVFCMDAAAITNSPYVARGLHLRGGSETVNVNFSKTSMKMLGALGAGTCHLHFCDSANTVNVIKLLEMLREKYGKVFVICDNASAHKSKDIKQYLEQTRGQVALWYLPPYTPQHNPIEIQWREIKRALAGRYYKGGFPEIQKSILHMMENGEVGTVRLLEYMRNAIQDAKNNALIPALRAA